MIKEIKSFVERYREIHGFDESKARGRPCETLPQYGNIPESNKEEIEAQKYLRIEAELNQLLNNRQVLTHHLSRLKRYLESQKEWAQVIKKNKHFIHGGKVIIKNSAINENPVTDKELASLEKPVTGEEASPKRKQEQLQETPNTLTTTSPKATKYPPKIYKNGTRIINELTDQLTQNITSTKIRISFISRQIAHLQKQQRSMSRLTPEAAYLQACSEFYMLRQQEEVETRIAVEQARVFRRKLGFSVQQSEMRKEQIALHQWKSAAQKYQRLVFDAKRKRKAEKGIVDDPEDERKPDDTADDVEEASLDDE